MRTVRHLISLVLAIYLLPGFAAAGFWAANDHPGSWREAKWDSARILPDPRTSREAHVAILAARTGGFKGAFAVHSWIVVKREGQEQYDRYDKVGWGLPVRKNGYVPDGRWYSNAPEIVWQATGADAERLIPEIETAIERYPHNFRGGYKLWPGPNSNTFVAFVMRAVPEIDAVLPPTAIGRDYLADGSFFAYDPAGDAHLTLYGLIGFSAGAKSGFEMHLLGLVAGFDFTRPGIKVPAFGRFGV